MNLIQGHRRKVSVSFGSNSTFYTSLWWSKSSVNLVILSHFPRKQNLKDRSQMGQSKLVSWCLKGGSWNKTHIHPLILSKWQTNKKHWIWKPKVKWESLIRGGTKCLENWPIEMNLKYTQLRVSPKQKTQKANWGCPLTEDTHPSEQETCSPLIESPRGLIAASWERTSQVQTIASDYLRNPC